MKTTELKHLLKQHGCYEIATNARGHDVWFSPITHAKRHQSREMAIGTVNAILKQAGI